MRAATWVMCWPLLGVLWFSATGAELLSAAAEGLDRTLERLMDFVEDA